jgi:hypothetical protein
MKPIGKRQVKKALFVNIKQTPMSLNSTAKQSNAKLNVKENSLKASQGCKSVNFSVIDACNGCFRFYSPGHGLADVVSH